MNSFIEHRQRLQQILGENLSQLSAEFLSLTTELKKNNAFPELQKKVDKLSFLYILYLNDRLNRL